MPRRITAVFDRISQVNAIMWSLDTEWPPLLNALFKGESTTSGLNSVFLDCFFVGYFPEIRMPFAKVLVVIVMMVVALLASALIHCLRFYCKKRKHAVIPGGDGSDAGKCGWGLGGCFFVLVYLI